MEWGGCAIDAVIYPFAKLIGQKPMKKLQLYPARLYNAFKKLIKL